MKEHLMSIGNWEICKADHSTGEVDVYAEHMRVCEDSAPRDKNVPWWCWEYNDPEEECWRCDKKVPK